MEFKPLFVDLRVHRQHNGFSQCLSLRPGVQMATRPGSCAILGVLAMDKHPIQGGKRNSLSRYIIQKHALSAMSMVDLRLKTRQPAPFTRLFVIAQTKQ